ncbi:MAG: hypothetical protein OEW15_08700 [Nitrospirota bacterium]|nr:hypothetical protein [Nitrospirota bacterium]
MPFKDDLFFKYSPDDRSGVYSFEIHEDKKSGWILIKNIINFGHASEKSTEINDYTLLVDTNGYVTSVLELGVMSFPGPHKHFDSSEKVLTELWLPEIFWTKGKHIEHVYTYIFHDEFKGRVIKKGRWKTWDVWIVDITHGKELFERMYYERKTGWLVGTEIFNKGKAYHSITLDRTNAFVPSSE